MSEHVERGGFVMVPGWLLDKQPTGNDVLTYCAMAKRGTWNPGTGCYDDVKPAIETLADDIGLSRSTVKRSIANLLGFGALHRTLQFDGAGDPAPSLYRVIFGAVVEPEKSDTEDGSPTNRRSRRRRSQGGRSTDEPRGRSTGGPTGRVTDEPRVGSPVDRNQEPTYQEPNDQDSVPATQVRRDDDSAASTTRRRGSTEQPTLDGSVDETPEQIEKRLKADRNDLACGIARGWMEWRAKNRAPIAGNRVMVQLRSLLLPFVEAGYDEDEIKWALTNLNEGIPSRAQMQRKVDEVRGAREAKQSARFGDRRSQVGPMTGITRHVDDISDEERDERNPFHGVARSSEVAGDEQIGEVA